MLSHVPEFPSSFKTPTVCVCAHMCMHITYIYPTFCLFINSFTGGHLGCFHLLAMVNNGAKNMGVHILFESLCEFFTVYTQEVEVLHCMPPFFKMGI